MYNVLLAIVIFLSHWRASFRHLEQKGLLHVFQNNISQFPLCRAFLKSILFLGRAKAILIFFCLAENFGFQPLLSPVWSQPPLRSTSEAGWPTALPLYWCPLFSVEANGLTLRSGRFARVLLEGFRFHEHCCLLAVSPNFAVLEKFVQQTSLLWDISKLLVRSWDSASIFAALCDQSHVGTDISPLQRTLKVPLICSPS